MLDAERGARVLDAFQEARSRAMQLTEVARGYQGSDSAARAALRELARGATLEAVDLLERYLASAGSTIVVFR